MTFTFDERFTILIWYRVLCCLFSSKFLIKDVHYIPDKGHCLSKRQETHAYMYALSKRFDLWMCKEPSDRLVKDQNQWNKILHIKML